MSYDILMSIKKMRYDERLFIRVPSALLKKIKLNAEKNDMLLPEYVRWILKREIEKDDNNSTGGL